MRWVDIRFNACYELLHKYTISWGHKYSMHSVREILQRNPPPPTPPPPFSFQSPYKRKELIPIQRTKLLATYRTDDRHGHQKGISS